MYLGRRCDVLSSRERWIRRKSMFESFDSGRTQVDLVWTSDRSSVTMMREDETHENRSKTATAVRVSGCSGGGCQ